jgi:hypothetical protein
VAPGIRWVVASGVLLAGRRSRHSRIRPLALPVVADLADLRLQLLALVPELAGILLQLVASRS